MNVSSKLEKLIEYLNLLFASTKSDKAGLDKSKVSQPLTNAMEETGTCKFFRARQIKNVGMLRYSIFKTLAAFKLYYLP